MYSRSERSVTISLLYISILQRSGISSKEEKMGDERATVVTHYVCHYIHGIKTDLLPLTHISY